MNQEELQAYLSEKLPDCQVRVSSPDGYHFEAEVVGERFAGLSRVRRQQVVMACVSDLLADNTVHALSLKVRTPDEL
ncbi:BolA/IbaG family iron-sulfur metabolism protein [Hahella sp. SMD15-11]|uniref:BolA/IbaG family iron-sulfur metabolism protein n=1 Tax=Thermohahella caldifontis TaxID=3142973 RepID=A0AB39UZ64_9GAMM